MCLLPYTTALPLLKYHSQALSPQKYLLPSSQDHPLSYSLLKDLFPQIVFSHPSCQTDGRVGLNSKADSFPNTKPISTNWLQYSSVGCISQVFPCSAQRTAGQTVFSRHWSKEFLVGQFFPDLIVSSYAKQVICLSSVAQRTISQYKYASEP